MSSDVPKERFCQIYLKSGDNFVPKLLLTKAIHTLIYCMSHHRNCAYLAVHVQYAHTILMTKFKFNFGLIRVVCKCQLGDAPG